MKILTLTEFDPCGYHLRHKRNLGAHGVDYRVLVRDIYRPEGYGVDWAETYGGKSPLPGRDPVNGVDLHRQLYAFAEEADILQFCPVIGQPWSYQHETFHPHDAADVAWAGLFWDQPLFKHKPRIALFHGSVNFRANVPQYALHYMERGYRLAATTVDYVALLRAWDPSTLYLPAIVDQVAPPADLRRAPEPLRVVQAPTDAIACSTATFASLCQRLGIEFTVISGLAPDACLRAKRTYPVGADHLRGGFSFNSLENAAMGMVNLTAISAGGLKVLKDEGLTAPFPVICQGIDDIERCLTAMRHLPELTAHLQQQALNLFQVHWSPDLIAQYVASIYRFVVEAAWR